MMYEPIINFLLSLKSWSKPWTHTELRPLTSTTSLVGRRRAPSSVPHQFSGFSRSPAVMLTAGGRLKTPHGLNTTSAQRDLNIRNITVSLCSLESQPVTLMLRSDHVGKAGEESFQFINVIIISFQVINKTWKCENWRKGEALFDFFNSDWPRMKYSLLHWCCVQVTWERRERRV